MALVLKFKSEGAMDDWGNSVSKFHETTCKNMVLCDYMLSSGKRLHSFPADSQIRFSDQSDSWLKRLKASIWLFLPLLSNTHPHQAMGSYSLALFWDHPSGSIFSLPSSLYLQSLLYSGAFLSPYKYVLLSSTQKRKSSLSLKLSFVSLVIQW